LEHSVLAFLLKHYERFKFHVAVARQIRYGIEERLNHEHRYRDIAKNSRVRDFEKVNEEEIDKRIAPYNKDLYEAYKKDLYKYWWSLSKSLQVIGTVLVLAGIGWLLISITTNPIGK